MAVRGKVFVTPHAVQRFRERIAPNLTYEEARDAILRGVEQTRSEPKRSTSWPGAVLPRVRRPYPFRAVIGPGEGELPAVLTVLRSGR